MWISPKNSPRGGTRDLSSEGSAIISNALAKKEKEKDYVPINQRLKAQDLSGEGSSVLTSSTKKEKEKEIGILISSDQHSPKEKSSSKSSSKSFSDKSPDLVRKGYPF